MSSRKEEKERLRQERLAAEQAEAKKAATRQRLWIVFGSVLALAAVVAIVVIFVSSGGDDGGGNGGPQTAEASDIKAQPIPPQSVANLNAAAKAAGCKVSTFPSEGREHTDNPEEKINYRTNPPTSGRHYVQWTEDGDYAGQDPPQLTATVHSLEHGRINFQYKPGTDPKVIGQMRTLFEEQGGYHSLLFQNQSGMKDAIAATAWTHSITCPQVNDKVWDALRAFRARYTDQGPETVA
jgi:Protein of unknown function (DUF3105)